MELKVQQGTDEWLLARVGIATASKFSDIMSRTPAPIANYKAELVLERITGKQADGFKSADMQWGTDNEPTARLMYSLHNSDVDVRECGIFLHPELKCGASPDGLIGDDGTLEIKCPRTATHIETLHRQTVPAQYYWQIQGQLWLTGRKWADFVSYDTRLPENASYFCKRVERNEEDISKLEIKVKDFLSQVDEEERFIRNYGGKE